MGNHRTVDGYQHTQATFDVLPYCAVYCELPTFNIEQELVARAPEWLVAMAPEWAGSHGIEVGDMYGNMLQ